MSNSSTSATSSRFVVVRTPPAQRIVQAIQQDLMEDLEPLELKRTTSVHEAKEVKQPVKTAHLAAQSLLKRMSTKRPVLGHHRSGFSGGKTTITTANYFNVAAGTLDYALDLNVAGASEWTGFSALFDECRISHVEAYYNFSRLISYGVDSNEQLCLFWAYDPTKSAAKTFDKLSDYSNGGMVPWSNAKPIVHRKCTPLGFNVTSSDEILKGWQPCSEIANTNQGTLLLSSTSPFVGTKPIYYRLVFHVEFRLRQGS